MGAQKIAVKRDERSHPLTPEILVPRLGEYLVENRVIEQDQLRQALRYQKDLRSMGKNPLLGEVLLELGLVDREELDQAITEQIIQLRTALQETNHQLENRVRERTAALQDALNQLSQLSQLKSNFIANISHELRTPLTHIKGYIELLLSGTMGPFNTQQSSAMQVIQRSAERLEQQIEDLISFSLAARGEMNLTLTATDLSLVFGRVAQRSFQKAADRKIKLYASLPTDTPCVLADEEKLSWALLHLVDNAIKFTPPEGSVTFSATPQKDHILLTIEDTGIGIPEERIKEIFEPFHQLDGSSTRRYGGTGLGLALVQHIIEAHGSTIRVSSATQKGSRFEFELPIVQTVTNPPAKSD